MASKQTRLGIKCLHSLELCVHQAAPWMAYFTDGFGFQHVAASTPADEERTGTRRRLLRAGDVRIVLQEAVHAGSYVRGYLARHPEGISGLNFQVADIERAETLLVERHATLIDHIRDDSAGGAAFRFCSIATPLGDVEFCFLQAERDTDLLPGLEPAAAFDPALNAVGIEGIDHLTGNLRTLMPVAAWYEHVLGFKRHWSVEFHTETLRPGVGGGLRSIIVKDPESGLRLANNEPLRPRFHQSQIQLYIDGNRGPGIQHLALRVRDITAAVGRCIEHGIEFLQPPKTYYAALPARIAALKIGPVAQPAEDLERHHLLLDGGKGGYLLQAFCHDQVRQFGRPDAGPLFIELVQRCGWDGFGEGNFRALFESLTTERRLDG